MTGTLEHDGFVALPDFMSADLLAEVRARVDELFEEEGEAAGSEFKQEAGSRRLANLVAKGEVFERIVTDRTILALMSEVLGPELKLSSLNVRSADPLSGGLQPLHVDGGFLPDGGGYCVCNSVWMLDDFTASNGALRVVPGSHKSGRLPQDVLADPLAPHPDELLVTGSAGTVVVMNAHLWHGGTRNSTERPRRAMHGYYTRRDLPQQQYQKRLVPPGVQAKLSAKARWVLALDDPRNDELCARSTGMSGFLK
jgi:ectoine hydroxylase-related dioxygenase (phytanoyl-CoA dioxygenase family)